MGLSKAEWKELREYAKGLVEPSNEMLCTFCNEVIDPDRLITVQFMGGVYEWKEHIRLCSIECLSHVNETVALDKYIAEYKERVSWML